MRSSRENIKHGPLTSTAQSSEDQLCVAPLIEKKKPFWAFVCYDSNRLIMPSSSSRLNIKYLENSDEKDSSSDSHPSPSRTSNSNDKAKNSSHHHQKDKVESNELSNDASNETSDSDNVSSDLREPFKPQISQQSMNPMRSSELVESESTNLPSHSSISNASVSTRVSDGDQEQSTAIPFEYQTSGTEDPKLSRTGLQQSFFCKICNQGFTRKHNMVSHELIHTSLKLHRCTLCDTTFRRIHDLRRHEKLHTGEKPFECDRCHRPFARSDALARHLNSPNACTGNILRGTTTASSSVKIHNDEEISSNTLDESNSAGVLTTETSVSATIESEKPPSNLSIPFISATNSASLILASNSQGNSACEATPNSLTSVSNEQRDDKPAEQSRLAMPSLKQDNSIPSSLLSSGSFDLNQYEINKWRPLQLYNQNEENRGETSSVSNEVRSEASSAADSTESSGGHINLRANSTGRSEYPKTTTTTTTTTTMEQGNGPMSQNHLQKMGHGREDVAPNSNSSDRHFYHHVHYYHHVQTFDGQHAQYPPRGQQYVSQSAYTGGNSGEYSQERFNGRGAPQRHQRVIASEGFNPVTQHVQYGGRPSPQQRNFSENIGDRSLRQVPFERRGGHPGGDSRLLPPTNSELDSETYRQPAEPDGSYRGYRLMQDNIDLRNEQQQQNPSYRPAQQRNQHQWAQHPLANSTQRREQLRRDQALQESENGGQYRTLPTSKFDQRMPQNQDDVGTNGKRSFVSMEKYENLMNYASNLQNSLSTLENRLVALESGKGRDTGQKRPEKRAKKPRDSEISSVEGQNTSFYNNSVSEDSNLQEKEFVSGTADKL